MKYLFLLFTAIIISSCASKPEPRYIFFLHNKFVELAGPTGIHPEYGAQEYPQVIAAFKEKGFIVLSDVRPKNADGMFYAKRVAHQIDSLLQFGISPSQITVIGTSKGGYIAKEVSNIVRNKDLNFVLIGCNLPSDITDEPSLQLCGNILSIYEESDSIGRSCNELKAHSTLPIPHYREIELHTGMKHGYVYKAFPLWMEPAMRWANKEYATVSTPASKEELVAAQIDSLITANPSIPFNGILLVRHDDRTVIAKVLGQADSTGKRPLTLSDQFIIGSISKQLTAVQVLRDMERGLIHLNDPIHKYLPELRMPWADSVTVHQLLSHTHGIVAIDSPLAFSPGSKFEYSNIGYHLLSQILEHIHNRSFTELSRALFDECDMKSTTDPHSPYPAANLINGFEIDSTGNRRSIPLSKSEENYLAAGGFASSVYDLITWTSLLHSEKLLKSETYKLMMTKYAVREHPIFGSTNYGYAMTLFDSSGIKREGHSGFSPGFASMLYYYPNSKTIVVLLQNLQFPIFNTSFFYHTAILELLDHARF